MIIPGKVTLVTLTSALILLLIGGGAFARNLSVDDQNFRLAWTGATKLSFSNDTGVASFRCNISLLGSFHRSTLVKTTGSLAGVLNTADLANCENGAVTFLQATLPWHVIYVSFRGTLPRITHVRLNLIGVSLAVTQTIFGSPLTCLMRSTAAEPFSIEMSLNEATGQITSVGPDNTRFIDMTDTTGTACDIFDIDGSFSGNANVVEDRAGNLLFLRLI